MFRLFLIFFSFTIFTQAISAQCHIENLEFNLIECEGNNEFFINMDFDYSNTSTSFKILGNGINYGTFSYDDLPLTLGPLIADCTTNYEFAIVDSEIGSCSNFINIGEQCCSDDCQILITNVSTSECDGLNFSMELDLQTNSTFGEIEIFYNNQPPVTYDSDEFPILIEGLTSSNFYAYNQIVACIKDNPQCCDTIQVVNNCICNIYNLQGQIVDCNPDDNTFSMIINFDYLNISDSFDLGGNVRTYGTFAYSDLPVTITNLPFSDTTYYEFLVVDKSNLLCFEAIEPGIIDSCPDVSCDISNLNLTVVDCDSYGEAQVLLSFDHKNTGVTGFTVSANGNNYGSFSYGADRYHIQSVIPDCETIYEFTIQDNYNEGCSATISLDSPICCDGDCLLNNLSIQTDCDDEDESFIIIDFTYLNSNSDQFILNINDDIIGEYDYSSLPVFIPANEYSETNIFIQINDALDSTCSISKTYFVTCSELPCAWSVSDLTVLECTDEGEFYVSFQAENLITDGNKFEVLIHGEVYTSFNYGDDEYEIGPFVGDCTFDGFLLQDVSQPDCRQEVRLSEPVCCDDGTCRIYNPILIPGSCHHGEYSLELNFGYLNTNTDFVVEIDGQFYGSFKYDQLPVNIEGLVENAVYSIKIFDKTDVLCRLSIEYEGHDCTSGTSDILDRSINVYNHHNVLYIDGSQSVNLNYISIFDAQGRWVKSISDSKTNSVEVDIRSFPTGIYFVQIMSGQNFTTKKFVKF